MRRLITTPALTALIISAAGAVSGVATAGATAATTAGTTAGTTIATTASTPAAARTPAPAMGTATATAGDRTMTTRRAGEKRPTPQPTDEPAATHVGPTYFVLTRSRSAEAGSGLKIVTLTCSPNGGTHPNADAACEDLNASHGNVERPPSDTICTMLWAPVSVTATGYWNFTQKQFRKTYSNECVMRTYTGDIFNF